MKKLILRIFFTFLFVFIGIIGGMYLWSYLHPDTNAVVVDVYNLTNNSIEKIIITHKNGTEEVCNVSSKQHQRIAFFPEGEDSYLIKVIFKNGENINGVGGYVEPGYTMKHEITKKGISTKYEF